MNDDILPTSEGVLRCLQALAEEAASLGLARTRMALEYATNVCRTEMRIPHSASQIVYAGLMH